MEKVQTDQAGPSATKQVILRNLPDLLSLFLICKMIPILSI